MSGRTGDLRGADPELVERAIADRDPLPGTADGPVRGFAGQLPDGRLVRDVLGRQPLYLERDADAPTDGSDEWAFEPGVLSDPELLPAGTVVSGSGCDRVWSLPDPAPEPDPESAIDAVRTALAGALDSTPNAAVAFSGGVDSSLVATATDGPLYVVGFPGSDDVATARDAADELGRELHVVELDHETLAAAVPTVARAIGRTNAMDVSIALPLYLAAERAAADGHDRLAVGQGADELFGGYAKVANAPDDTRVEADTVRGARREVLTTLPDQLPRDVLALRAAGVEPVAPLLDDRVVTAALPLPGARLVGLDGTRKVALRRAAREWLPDRIAAREKNAVQYGSEVSKELDRIARQTGYKRRMGDHVRKYVESRLP